MKPIPKWKKWLSYLFEFHLESASSDYNPHMYVSLYKGQYQLSTDNAIYSFGNLYTNFSSTFDCYKWDKYPPKDVLLLGLGLGSIPFMLEDKYQQKCNFTAIDIDEEVIDLAYRYLLSSLESPVEMITANAAIAVHQFPEESYDLICVDVFDSDEVPEEIESFVFLEQIKNILKPGGVILFNRLAATDKDCKKSEAFFNDRFKKVFPKADILGVEGNYMLVTPAAAVGM